MSLSKLFQRIIWHNNTTPAINEDNLNAMSKAIDDIDDRVILIGDDVVTVIPQIQAYLEQAESIVEAVEELSQNPPYIGANGNWYVFDTTLEAYKDSGVDASITVDIADITMIAEGAQPYVTNTGTSTDPIFHLFLPRSPQGATGNGIANIAKTSTQGLVDTYTITMTDGTTYTFTVTNGQNGSGTGDMLQSDYDSDSTVKNSGGISSYVTREVTREAYIRGALGVKNLFPNKLTSSTQLGITFTVNADKSITANGTFTEQGAVLLSNGWVDTDIAWIKPYEGKDVFITGGVTNVTFSVSFYNASGTKIGSIYNGYSGGRGAGTIPSNIAYYVAFLYPNSASVTLTNAVFRPMIRFNTDLDNTYQPYAMTNQELTPYAKAQSNPNLLDNPWFTVNQRGASNYNVANSYTVDRWKIVDNTDNLGIIAVNSGGISIDNTSGSKLLNYRQIVTTSQSSTDLYNSLLGKTVTLSIMFTDGTVESTTGIIPSNPSDWTPICRIENTTKLKGTVGLQMNSGATFVTIGTWAGYAIQNIKAMKLELGSVSTLAQDTAPNYAQELLKCQRYFISFGDSSTAEALGFGQGTLTDNAVIYVPIPVKMRANPSIATLTGTIYLRNESTPYVITNAHVEVGGVACVVIGVSATGAIPGKPYEAFLEIGAKLELSADL